jgi:hypothetical protein
VSITVLFFFGACSGRYGQVKENSNDGQKQEDNSIGNNPFVYSPLVTDWGKRYESLNFEPIRDFLENEKIAAVTFITKDGNVYISNVQDFVKGQEIRPCGMFKGPVVIPVDGSDGCVSIVPFRKLAGLNQQLTHVTSESPYCITITIGGYVIEFDPFTGGPCEH